MDEKTKIEVRIALFFLSAISILVISFIDYNMGSKLLEFHNPLADEDWIITILGITVFIISVVHLIAQCLPAYWKKSITILKKKKISFMISLIIYILVLIFSFIDIHKYPFNIKNLTVDYLLHRDEDLILAIVSILSIFLYAYDYKQV